MGLFSLSQIEETVSNLKGILDFMSFPLIML